MFRSHVKALCKGKRVILIHGYTNIIIRFRISFNPRKQLSAVMSRFYIAHDRSIIFIFTFEFIAGITSMTKLKDHHMDDYIDLFRQFEIKKREMPPSKEKKLTIRIPRSFVDIVEKRSMCNINEYLKQTTYRDTMSFVSDKLRMDAKIFRSCFKKTIKNILGHVEKLLKEPSVADCSAILMVGGFSDSPMLHEAIQKRYPQLKTIIPEGAGLVVLKGSVVYGHDPTTVAERKC